MADPERGRPVLGELRRLGVRTSIDDYGTGYSSLAYLRHLPADELKLDRSLTADVGPGPPGRPRSCGTPSRWPTTLGPAAGRRGRRGRRDRRRAGASWAATSPRATPSPAPCRSTPSCGWLEEPSWAPADDVH